MTPPSPDRPQTPHDVPAYGTAERTTGRTQQVSIADVAKARDFHELRSTLTNLLTAWGEKQGGLAAELTQVGVRERDNTAAVGRLADSVGLLVGQVQRQESTMSSLTGELHETAKLLTGFALDAKRDREQAANRDTALDQRIVEVEGAVRGESQHRQKLHSWTEEENTETRRDLAKLSEEKRKLAEQVAAHEAELAAKRKGQAQGAIVGAGGLAVVGTLIKILIDIVKAWP